MNYEGPFPRDSRYWRVCDIMEVDIIEFKVYMLSSKVVKVLSIRFFVEFRVATFK